MRLAPLGLAARWFPLAAICACGAATRGPAPAPRSPTPALATRVPAAPASVPPSRIVLHLTTDPDAEGRVLAALVLEGKLVEPATSLRFAPAHDARVTELHARDDGGEIEVRAEPDGAATRFTLARPGSGTLEVRYRVAFGAPARKGEPFAPWAEPIEMAVEAEDVLVLPDVAGDDRVAVDLQLKTGGVSSGGASSFALGSTQHVMARPSELRGATFFAGDVGTAAFHGSDGDDFGAWVGFTAFDPRWVSAEIAGVRSAVDAFVGRSTSADTPPNAVLFSGTRRDDPPIVVRSRTRGLVLSVDRRAAWTPAVRILVTQALTQRYIGGFLWVGDRRDPSSGAFFSDGFSRAIAREILFDATWLAPADRAAELNALLATVAFANDKTDPHAVVTARGALAATALDVALRRADGGGKRSLKTFVRERLAQAAQEKRDTLPFADFVARAREGAGDDAARELESTLSTGAEATLPSELLGPCYRLVKKQLVAFELGFVTSSDAELRVESVITGSRAEAAGLRVGDVVRDVHYDPSRSAVPVQLSVVRGGRTTSLRFLPAGATRPGRQFERVPGIPDDRCQ